MPRDLARFLLRIDEPVSLPRVPEDREERGGEERGGETRSPCAYSWRRAIRPDTGNETDEQAKCDRERDPGPCSRPRLTVARTLAGVDRGDHVLVPHLVEEISCSRQATRAISKAVRTTCGTLGTN